MKTFKVGDWCIYGYEICQIKEMEDGYPVAVSDGMFSTSGNQMHCYELTLANKRAAEFIKHYADKIHRHPQSQGLNHPDLHRKAVNLAYDIMDVPEKNEEGKKAAYAEAEKFYADLFTTLDNLGHETIGGVSIFGRR